MLPALKFQVVVQQQVKSDLENGENKIEFTFTVDSKTPFQIKFKSEGNFVITPVFEKITK